MFVVVFGIHCSFFIVLPIQRKTRIFNDVFFIFARENVRAQKIGRVSEVLRAQACPISIGRAIFLDLLIENNLIHLLRNFFQKLMEGEESFQILQKLHFQLAVFYFIEICLCDSSTSKTANFNIIEII